MASVIPGQFDFSKLIRCSSTWAHSLSVSVGIYKGTAILDLDYAEDSNAETDMNVVMNGEGHFIEVQGTAEGHAFSADELNEMLVLAQTGINELFEIQRNVLAQ